MSILKRGDTIDIRSSSFKLMLEMGPTMNLMQFPVMLASSSSVG